MAFEVTDDTNILVLLFVCQHAVVFVRCRRCGVIPKYCRTYTKLDFAVTITIKLACVVSCGVF